MGITAVPISDWVRHLGFFVIPSDAKTFQNTGCCHVATDEKEKKRNET